jgi:hypothetical protein
MQNPDFSYLLRRLDQRALLVGLLPRAVLAIPGAIVAQLAVADARLGGAQRRVEIVGRHRPHVCRPVGKIVDR